MGSLTADTVAEMFNTLLNNHSKLLESQTKELKEYVTNVTTSKIATNLQPVISTLSPITSRIEALERTNRENNKSTTTVSDSA